MKCSYQIQKCMTLDIDMASVKGSGADSEFENPKSTKRNRPKFSGGGPPKRTEAPKTLIALRIKFKVDQCYPCFSCFCISARQ